MTILAAVNMVLGLAGLAVALLLVAACVVFGRLLMRLE